MDITQHLGPCPDQHTFADLGVTVFLFLAGAAESDGMQHRDIVTHHGSFADHDGMGMVDHDALADPGGGVDIDAEGFRHAHLEEIGQILPPGRPEPMGHAVGLHGLKALEEQERLQEAVASRVAVVDGHDVGARGQSQSGIGAISLVADFTDQLFGHLARGQFQGGAIGECTFDGAVMQHAGMDQTAQHGFVLHGLFRFGQDAVPDRVDLRKFRLDFRHGFVLFIVMINQVAGGGQTQSCESGQIHPTGPLRDAGPRRVSAVRTRIRQRAYSTS